MVSPEGIDNIQCFNNTTSTACRTLSYTIKQGFTSICVYGVLDNRIENIDFDEISVNQNEINIFCKECLFKNSEIRLSCKKGENCRISFHDLRIQGGNIRMNNTYLISKNVVLEDTVIETLPDLSISAYNEIHFEDSTLSCYEKQPCGLYLTDIHAVKVVFTSSQLYNYALNISMTQLMLIIYNTSLIMPHITVKVHSFEYLRVPAIIKLANVTMKGTGTPFVKKQKFFKVKRYENSQPIQNLIIFEVTNPQIMITDCRFIGIHLKVQSKRRYFEPIFFELLIEKSSFMNSVYIGEGGGLKIFSEVQNSKVLLSDCVFSNNSALKGPSNVKGRGGGMFIEAQSLTLEMINNTFLNNKASDLGLAMCTTEAVEVSIINCTFQYIIDPSGPVRESIMFVNGKIIKFQGRVQVFNRRPESNVESIDMFYINQGANLHIDIMCPKWYNHIVEYTSESVESQTLSNIKSKCSPCNLNYYTTGVEKTVLAYSGEDNITRAEMKKGINGHQEKDMCLKCPYGGLCIGNNVIPRPNYWGYWHEGELVFQQCPADYCCSGTDSSICGGYDHCPGNRTGILCGVCQEGFSVSILTGGCTMNNRCGRDQWFWPLAILAAMAYVLWYTLKDDIFDLLIFSIRYLRGKTKNESKSNVKDIPMLSYKTEQYAVSSY